MARATINPPPAIAGPAESLLIHFSPEELVRLRRMAAAQDVSPSDYVRKAVRAQLWTDKNHFPDLWPIHASEV